MTLNCCYLFLQTGAGLLEVPVFVEVNGAEGRPQRAVTQLVVGVGRRMLAAVLQSLAGRQRQLVTVLAGRQRQLVTVLADRQRQLVTVLAGRQRQLVTVLAGRHRQLVTVLAQLERLGGQHFVLPVLERLHLQSKQTRMFNGSVT